MCSQCFRCKLGSISQASHRAYPPAGHKIGKPVGRVRVRERQEPTEEAKMSLMRRERQKIVPVLDRYGVTRRIANEFAVGVADAQNCTSRRSCCSIRGSEAADFELGMRYQVRGEWPRSGTYNDAVWARVSAETERHQDVRGIL